MLVMELVWQQLYSMMRLWGITLKLFLLLTAVYQLTVDFLRLQLITRYLFTFSVLVILIRLH